VSARSQKEKVRVLPVEPQPRLARLCQRAVVVLALVVLVFATLAFGAVRWWALGPVMLGVAGCVALWIVRVLVQREARVVYSRVGVPLMVLAAYAVVRSTGLAEVEPVARNGMMLALAATLLFFALVNNIRHRWHLSALVWVLSVTGTVVAAYGLWQFASDSRLVWWFPQPDAYAGRASGTFLRPNHFAAFLAMAFPVAAANFVFSRRGPRQKLALLIGCVVMGAGLLCSFAPSGWLGWAAGLIVLGAYAIRRRGRKFRWLVVAAAVMGAVMIAALAAAYALREPRAGAVAHPLAEPYRWPLWRSAFEIARNNIWLGAGPGMFRWLYPAHRTLQGEASHAGSEYLTLFAEGGLLGCVLAFWTAAAFIVATLQILHARGERYSAATPSNRYAFAVGGLAAFVSVLVGSVFDACLRAPANLFVLAALMAATLTCGVHPSGKIEQDVLLPGRYSALEIKGLMKFALAAALAVALALLLSRLLKTYPSDLLMRLAERERRALNWTAAERRYRQAWNADKRNFAVTAAFGDFYSARATWNTDQREEFLTRALSWYERAFVTNPYAADVLVKMGRTYDRLGRRDQALERYRRALQLDPRNASYHTQLGLHHQRWQDTEKAIASYRRALQLDPDDPMARLQLDRLAAPAS
jgi:tetratricopeptide (TPR) repeat protein